MTPAPLRGGRRDRRIRIMRAGAAQHDGMQNVPGADTVIADKLAANYRPGAGGERFENAETAATTPAIFTVRWSARIADLNAKDWIVYPPIGGALYDISRVEEIGRREGLRIFAVERGDR